MSLFDRLRRTVRALTRRQQLDAELDEELRFHIDRHVEQLVGRGMDPATARTEALRLFGGVEKVKEECRDERNVSLVDGLVQDVAYAFRMLRKSKAFAALTVVTLALGIGANTAIFSVVNGVLLAPLPYEDGERLVLLGAEAEGDAARFSIVEFYELDVAAETLDLVEYHGMNFTLLGHGYPSNVSTGVVSHDFFDVLGVDAHLGRTFLPGDEAPDAEAVLVLSHRYWQAEFGGDPHLVGQLFEMNDRPHRVIGVLPPLPHYPEYNDVYMPTSACPYRGTWEPIGEDTPRRAFSSLTVFGRLRPGAEMRQADAELEVLAASMRERLPGVYGGVDYGIQARALHEVLTERARPMLLTLLGVVALVLAVACANAANLMVARVLQRERELALRSAMGAGRGRLVRQLLTESTLLSLAGGALGLLLAWGGLGLLIDFAARFTSRIQSIQIDGQVLAFTLAVALLTGIAAGVLPALWPRIGAGHLHAGAGTHATHGRGAMRLRGGLIAAQVALSFMLLIGAGLMIRSLVKLAAVDSGFAHENVLTARVYTNWTEYEDLEARVGLFSDLLEELENGPGVVSAAVSNTVPFAAEPGEWTFHIDERLATRDEAEAPHVEADSSGRMQRGWAIDLMPIGISADYFTTLGIAVLEGRMLTADELTARAPLAMISESARVSYWPDKSPIGGRIAIPDPHRETDWVWHTIVGVVADARYYGPADDAPRVLYSSYRSFGGAGQLLVRTSTEAQTMSAYIQETVARIAPLQSVGNFQTYARLRSASIATPRLIATLLSLFAGLALLMTVAGVAGTVAFSIGQRRQEIGIRLALGAARSNVLAMVLRQGLSMVMLGLAVGFFGALWLSRAVVGYLFQTRPTDPVTFLSVALVLLSAAIVACLLPARRAISIDPVITLRAD